MADGNRHFEQDAPVVRVVADQTREEDQCWPDVGVVGKDLAVMPLWSIPGPHEPEPGIGDFRLEIAVVPGEAARLG